MNISNQYTNVSMTSSVQSQNVDSRPMPPPPKDDELSSFFQSVQGDEEIRDFMKSAMEMEMSGEFDAAALAESAPESLKAYAEENDIDLESYFQEKHEHFSERKDKMGEQGMPPPPPQGQGSELYQQISNMAGDNDELIQALMSSLNVSEKV
ncbi:hypothetical protein [Pseudoalteromonas xiamenensis]|uniref:Uncharacterized protein n=1 Tax=Pseudoalteromonas xiamenensis TaxID=882626 RepID=A0A975DI46_9GAMM|nr:hypothetical protein [Pseudoalteromonas xiamenensis]QTH72198.1 hypothetical protein J5O05_04750 [Pseudoalteromonas xiamenensis]